MNYNYIGFFCTLSLIFLHLLTHEGIDKKSYRWKILALRSLLLGVLLGTLA